MIADEVQATHLGFPETSPRNIKIHDQTNREVGKEAQLRDASVKFVSHCCAGRLASGGVKPVMLKVVLQLHEGARSAAKPLI